MLFQMFAPFYIILKLQLHVILSFLRAKVLHTSCLSRWMTISGKPKIFACPFKCFNELSGISPEGAEAALLSQASQSQSQAQPAFSMPLVHQQQTQLVDIDDESQPILS